MPTKKEVTDTFFTDLVCGERRTFKTDRHRTAFKKLHFKKCVRCSNAPNISLGWNEVSFTDGQASSYMESRERLILQENIVRTFVS